MSYASLLSLGQTLEQILHPDNESLLLLLHQKEQQLMRSLYEKVDFLLEFLEVISPKSSKQVIRFEKGIRDAAHEAEDLIESQMYSEQIPSESHLSNHLQKVKEELDTISEDLAKMKESNEIESWQPAASSKSCSTYKCAILGFDGEMRMIQGQLFRGPLGLLIFSIVGRPGQGKTTLAKKIYNDSRTAAHFDICGWVTVSRKFHEQQLIEDILISIGDLNHESRQQNKDKLAEKLHKRLKDKRFLIVMDDVWDNIAVEKIKSMLPKDNNGSRILLTSQRDDVASSANPYIDPYRLRYLSESECWNLLRDRAFREERCPLELEDLGKRIARICRGYPLLTVLTAGLLYRAQRTIDYWEYVVTNMHIPADTSYNTIFHPLPFFYNQLPHHLRACFLYMGVLPEDYAIHRSKLIKLWVANGFIRPDKLKSMEEVAEEYLKDLVNRNLIMVREWTRSGEIKTCCIHDLIRDFCQMKAWEEKMDSKGLYLLEVHHNLRHVNIFTYTIPNFELAQNRNLHVRSITFFSCNSPNDIHFVKLFRLLRILDALTLSLDEFPVELVELITLRYIALSFWLKHKIPSSVSRLRNLETLIINPGKLRSIFSASFLAPEIWKMSHLRHLLFMRGFLPYPTQALNRGTVLFKNLQTLSNVINFRWTKEVLQMMPNLKKLVISYEHDGQTEWSSYCFDNFDLLHQLEVLKCFFFGKSYMKYQDPLPMKFAFPQKLRRLTLSGSRISWKDMTIIGSLPSLQVLKLKFHAFEGSVWEANNREFRQLKFLLIHMTDLEHWEADETHFPCLEHLTLNYCYNLLEIPSGVRNIPTLQEINLCGCSTSVMTSADVIQEERRKLGKNGFQVMLKRDDDDVNILS